MLYAIISEDHPNSLALRLQHRQAHVNRLKELAGQNRLLLAGPHPSADTEDFMASGVSGSLVVAEFASLREAEEWAGNDPYVTGGVHQSVRVKPFIKVLP